MTANKIFKNKIDVSIKISLVLIIVLLLIHNCVLIRNRDKYQNAPVPNGNVDVIEINCDKGKCSATPTPSNKPGGKDDNAEITNISFAQNNISVKKGNTVKLIPIVKPGSKVSSKLTWKSSNPSIASVDANGKIKGLKEGTVTITVISPNGKTAKCTVTVTKKSIKVDKIILNPTEMNLKVGDIEQVSLSVSPKNATERDITWSTSDKSIATVDENGIIKALKSGKVTITAKTKDGNVKATVSVIVEDISNTVDVYDDDYDSVTWNGSNELNIFSKSIYNVDGFIAPESENTYKFIVKNNTIYKIKYNVTFIETNEFNINMKYKLKKNDNYLVNTYSKPSSLSVSNFKLNPGESDTYYLDWKWISSSNDVSIGTNPEANYGLKIEVEAESVNE